MLTSELPLHLDGVEGSRVNKRLIFLIGCGADPERVKPELFALETFAAWAGTVVALQKRIVTEAQYKKLERDFLELMYVFSDGLDVGLTGSISYASFGEWLEARMLRYRAIAESTTDVRVASKTIAEHFWDFAAIGSPSGAMRTYIIHLYERSVMRASRIVSSFDLLSGE